MTKYWGGKLKIGKDIAQVMLSQIGSSEGGCGFRTYWEPFLGMGGVMRHMALPMQERGMTVVESDLIPAVMAMWRYLQEGKDFKFALELTSAELEELRETKDKCSALHGFVGHGCGYFGVYFSGKLKFSDYQVLLGRAYRNTEKVRKWVGVPHFARRDFFAFAEVRPPRNTVMYLDPPYRLDQKSCKTRVWAIASEFSTEKFWAILAKWSEPRLNNLIFVSETEAPEGWVCIWSKKGENNLPGSTHTRFKREEKLFIYSSTIA